MSTATRTNQLRFLDLAVRTGCRRLAINQYDVQRPPWTVSRNPIHFIERCARGYCHAGLTGALTSGRGQRSLPGWDNRPAMRVADLADDIFIWVSVPEAEMKWRLE
ncbi:hypothetical protein PGT21_021644 [Puccinia graminis f. sp. tritici]|uniref:Uncharacterized protein n=1 Tax=Puccinia graminis f. sp. tritici TaxID=56615 RepID=A0A5B0QC20_PUCGR|nr:hypothetical protein PGT21_021644 [Puccinia graminis f. sp. tritici]